MYRIIACVSRIWWKQEFCRGFTTNIESNIAGVRLTFDDDDYKEFSMRPDLCMQNDLADDVCVCVCVCAYTYVDKRRRECGRK